MPKTQQGQVVHGGKNFERAARKDAAKKQRKADKEAEYAIWLKAEEIVKSLQGKLREAGVPFKTALPNGYELIEDEESGECYYSTEESADEGYPSLKQLSRRASKIEDLYEKQLKNSFTLTLESFINLLFKL